ncbi:GNAT family N-acetyltransferase [Kitasatospora sp. NPDC096147]|uniref:GNAT family N-acetyltransferase n=1 Tax=Kitasatospora sp. NPDC096147 TaxID=3364093 RepID=UPI00381ECDE6
MTPLLLVNRVSDTQWQAVDDAGRIAGHGDVTQRPDGRRYLSIDVWQDAAFTPLATAIATDLPAPLHTLVGESEAGPDSRWQQAGYAFSRREWEYLLPTAAAATGSAPVLPPGVTIVPGTEADDDALRALDRALREEIDRTTGWHTLPAEVAPRPEGTVLGDPRRYAVAVAEDGTYLGLVRVAVVPRRARIGLLAVLAGSQRRGVGRALLAHALGILQVEGFPSAWAEVDESNRAAAALLDGFGAQRVGSVVELVRR